MVESEELYSLKRKKSYGESQHWLEVMEKDKNDPKSAC